MRRAGWSICQHWTKRLPYFKHFGKSFTEVDFGQWQRSGLPRCDNATGTEVTGGLTCERSDATAAVEERAVGTQVDSRVSVNTGLMADQKREQLLELATQVFKSQTVQYDERMTIWS